MEHIVIIGNGIVELRLHVIFEKIRFKITIVSSETEFFFSRTALMYVFMGHMKFEHTQPMKIIFGKKQN
jgi:NAD(P)H-nitrite reductase large subunit